MNVTWFYAMRWSVVVHTTVLELRSKTESQRSAEQLKQLETCCYIYGWTVPLNLNADFQWRKRFLGAVSVFLFFKSEKTSWTSWRTEADIWRADSLWCPNKNVLMKYNQTKWKSLVVLVALCRLRTVGLKASVFRSESRNGTSIIIIRLSAAHTVVWFLIHWRPL